MHGMAAGWGKVGAAVGAFLYPLAFEFMGLSALMILQAIVCAAGWWLNERYVPWPVDDAYVSIDEDTSTEYIERELDDIEEDEGELEAARGAYGGISQSEGEVLRDSEAVD